MNKGEYVDIKFMSTNLISIGQRVFRNHIVTLILRVLSTRWIPDSDIYISKIAVK